VSSKQKTIFSVFELKRTETQSVSVVFCFISQNQKIIFSACLPEAKEQGGERFKDEKNQTILYISVRNQKKLLTEHLQVQLGCRLL
jgi:hypothetical protein